MGSLKNGISETIMAADALPVVRAGDCVIAEFVVWLLAGLDRADGVLGKDGHAKTIFGGDAEFGRAHVQIKCFGGKSVQPIAHG